MCKHHLSSVLSPPVWFISFHSQGRSQSLKLPRQQRVLGGRRVQLLDGSCPFTAVNSNQVTAKRRLLSQRPLSQETLSKVKIIGSLRHVVKQIQRYIRYKAGELLASPHSVHIRLCYFCFPVGSPFIFSV